MKKILNKKLILFLSIFFIVGIIFGFVFVYLISDLDKYIIKEGLNEYINSINTKTYLYKEGLILSLKTNLLYIIVIALSGLIFIFAPILFFTIFYKGFTIGFLLSSFFLTYKLKGLLYALLFIFPHEILNVAILIIFSIYALRFSRKLITSIHNNQEVNLRKLLKNYLILILIFMVSSLISSVLEIYLSSFLIRLFI